MRQGREHGVRAGEFGVAVSISDRASAFAPGKNDALRVQWTPGQVFGAFVGARELAEWTTIPGLGVLALDPASAVFLGQVTTSASGAATSPYTLPNDRGILGARLGMQDIGTSPSGLVLSTFQAMTVR